MASWRFDPDRMDDDFMHSTAGRYQEAFERAERERRELGWQAPDGWARPVDPPCPEHGYGMVAGRCGMCVRKEALLSEREKPRVAGAGETRELGGRLTGDADAVAKYPMNGGGAGSAPHTSPARSESDVSQEAA